MLCLARMELVQAATVDTPRGCVSSMAPGAASQDLAHVSSLLDLSEFLVLKYVCLVIAAICAKTTEGDATWGATNSGSTAYGSCVSGYVGTPSRDCTGCGTWGPICNPCEPAYCPSGTSQGLSWPQTSSGATATGSCPSGTCGNPTRMCFSNGTWGNVIGSCQSKLVLTFSFGYDVPLKFICGWVW